MEQGGEVEAQLMKLPSPEKQKTQPDEIQKTNDGRRLIKEGLIRFETSDIDKTRSQITASVSANNGYISLDQEEKSSDQLFYTLIVRIPSAKFDSFLESVTKGITTFDNKEIQVKDVTADYFDTEARLKAKKEIESRYLQLLSKASTVNDILNIEKELGNVRIEIESAEGQLKLLADQVQFSTLTIKFYKITSTPALFGYQIRTAFLKGWDNLLFVLVLLVDLWPFLLLFRGLWYTLRVIKKRKLEKAVTIEN